MTKIRKYGKVSERQKLMKGEKQNMDSEIEKRATQEYIKQHGESPKLIDDVNLERYNNANVSAEKAFTAAKNCDIKPWITPGTDSAARTRVKINKALVLKIPHVALEGSELDSLADMANNSDVISFVAKKDASEMYIDLEVKDVFRKEDSN